MARMFFVKLRSGKKVPSKHPAARSEKFCRELKYGVNEYNGKQLTKNEKAWRAGYMSARQDAAEAHKASRRSGERKSRQSLYNRLFGGMRKR